MTEMKIMGEKGTRAVKKLRVEKLKNGFPFMINSKDLLSNQCYLEYPDGTIRIVALKSDSRDFKVIRELSSSEADSLRRKYNLYL